MKTKLTQNQLAAAHKKALDAAAQAANEAYARNNNTDWDACGFAWAKVDFDGRTKLAKMFQKLGFRKDWNYGYKLWNPSGYGGQSISIKEAGAEAYVKVMREALGIADMNHPDRYKVFSGSRMD
jgi:hypothetical protein